MLGYLVSAVAAGAAPVAVAWPTKLLVNRLAAGPVRWPEVAGLAAAIAGAGVVAAVLPQVEQYLRREIDRRVQLTAVHELYQAVDRFVGLSRFEDPTFLDELQLARSNGVSAPGQCLDGTLGIVQAVVTVAGFASALFLLQPWVAILVLLVGTVPALYAQTALSRRRAAIMATTSQAERREVFYASLMTDPRAAKEVRLFGAGPFFGNRMTHELQHINASYRHIDRRTLAVHGGLALLAASVAGSLLLWTVRTVTTGATTVGDVVLVIAAVASVQAALSALVTNAVGVHEALMLFSYYSTVVTAPTDLVVRPDPQPTPPLRRGIELRDVWFRYGDDQPWVLRGLNLYLSADSTTAVVGLNGAGKTTLIKLLCRLYDPSRGAVYWDGVDLRDLDPGQLRRRVRAVFQDATAYDLTAAENIAVGDLSHLDDRGEIERAAHQAGAHQLITDLPYGYDTLLSRIFYAAEAEQDQRETGATLSGGQWQRLALARGLLLQDADLLVLDEPTAALDAEAEHDTHRQLQALRAGRATLLVSHRLGTVRNADQIVVLSDGRIVEQGHHGELVAHGGAYARLFALQADGYRGSGTAERVSA